MSNDETSLLTATNNIDVFSFSSVCVRVSFFLPFSLYLYSSRRKETGDVDIFSMSVRSNRSCSTQLSCQHPTQQRLRACHRCLFCSRFFSLCLDSSLGSALARWWLIAVATTTANSRLSTKSVCLTRLVFHLHRRLDLKMKKRSKKTEKKRSMKKLHLPPFLLVLLAFPSRSFCSVFLEERVTVERQQNSFHRRNIAKITSLATGKSASGWERPEKEEEEKKSQSWATSLLPIFSLSFSTISQPTWSLDDIDDKKTLIVNHQILFCSIDALLAWIVIRAWLFFHSRENASLIRYLLEQRKTSYNDHLCWNWGVETNTQSCKNELSIGWSGPPSVAYV